MPTCQAVTKTSKNCRNKVSKGRLCYLHKKSRLSTPRRSRKSKRRTFKRTSHKSRSWRSTRRTSKGLNNNRLLKT